MFETPLQEPRTDSPSDTHHRIIEAAGELFSESGYRHTTIRAVCRLAEANVAAVNYHFGNKKNLYLATLKYWRARAFEEYPIDLNDYSRPAEERIHTFVRTFLSRVLNKGEGSRFARLMAQELVQPTDALDVIVEETIRPTFAFLSTAVRELFCRPPAEEELRLCCVSIVGQIFYFYMSRHVTRRLFGREIFEMHEIDSIARHISEFSLAAIRAIAAGNRGGNE
ncbi:MAG: putative DNA-binding transcriptional regulator [Syntrophorhabdaceae bacterium PtaU1.Bin034]|nr:MAG: putative DNA-binding transcriptional regulator [Syntrophorhabdaceae bacterium PtaU1.Bin034]